MLRFLNNLAQQAPAEVLHDTVAHAGRRRGDGLTGFSCVRPDADIVVPVYLSYTAKQLVPPFAHERNISVLLRIKVDANIVVNRVANHGAVPCPV